MQAEMTNEAIKDEAELTLILAMLAASFPSAQVTQENVKAYKQMLRDVPLYLLRTACEQIAVENTFFPSIAEIRNKALSLSSPAFNHPSSADAWGIVIDAIKDFGYYNQPKFNNPLIARAVRTMDWQQLCVSENHMADRAHFMKIYDALKAREEADAKLLPQSKEIRGNAVSSRPSYLREVKQEQLPQGEMIPRGEVIELLREAVGNIGAKMNMNPEPVEASNVTQFKREDVDGVLVCGLCKREVLKEHGYKMFDLCGCVDGAKLYPKETVKK